MKHAMAAWLTPYAGLKGLLSCGLRYPDDSSFIPPNPNGLKAETMEFSLRCMADTYQVLKLNHFPNRYVRWIYRNGFFYSVQRPDGIFLGLFTRREPEGLHPDMLQKIVTEFLSLNAVNTPTAPSL